MNGGVNGNTGHNLDPLVVLTLSGICRPAGMATFMDKHEESVTSGLFVGGTAPEPALVDDSRRA